MRTLPLVIALGVLPAALSAQQKLARRMATAPDPSIRIVNLIGRTVVRGWDVDSIVVTGALPARGASFYMGGSVRGVKLGIESTDAGADAGTAAGTTLEVRVPRRARVWVKGATADIVIEGVTGEVDVYTVGGNVAVTGTPALLTAESMDGDVDVNARARVTRVKTAGGDITLRGAGGDITVSSVSGTVRLLEIDALATGHVESVSGAVIFRGALAAGGTLDLQTHDAPIELSLPASQGATVDVSAFGGPISNAIPGVSAHSAKGRPTRYSLGSGDARISVRSLKGEVRLRRLMPRPNPSP
jgi:hypothetical protein